MRICYILLSPTFGMHQYTADLANRMAESHEVCLVTTRRLPRDRYGPAVQIHTPVAFGNTGLSPQIGRLDWLRRLYRLLDELRPDAVHFTGPHLWNGLLAGRLQRQGARVIHTIHDLDPHQGRPLGSLLGLWNRSIAQRVDTVLVHGRQYYQRLREQGLPPGRLYYLPLLHLFVGYRAWQALRQAETPPHGPALSPTPALAAAQNGAPFLLFFGRLEIYKGVGDLLAAYERVGEAAGAGRLILAGPGELPQEWAGRLPAGVELRQRLISDDEALALFRECRALVLPYVSATQSALVAAAYFFGKPVIVTQSGALPEYVQEGRTGFIVPVGDANALAEKLAYALTRPEEMRQMGQAGRAWYESQRAVEAEGLRRLYAGRG